MTAQTTLAPPNEQVSTVVKVVGRNQIRQIDADDFWSAEAVVGCLGEECCSTDENYDTGKLSSVMFASDKAQVSAQSWLRADEFGSNEAQVATLTSDGKKPKEGVSCSSLRAKLRAAKKVEAYRYSSDTTDSAESDSSSIAADEAHCDVQQQPNLVDPLAQLQNLAPVDVDSRMGLGPVEGCSYSIVLFLPDIAGGEAVDSASSIFEMAAEEIAQYHAVDCYRLRWLHANPSELYALSCVIRVIKEAVNNAQRGSSGPVSHFKIFLVGHAFGGTIATKAACLLSSQFDESASSQTIIEVDCLCTIDTPAVEDFPLGGLAQVRNLHITGGLAHAADSEAYSKTICELPCEEKEFMVLPVGAQKELVAALVGYVIQGMLEI